MNNEVFFKISKIIERDSKTTTYKFALLRGVIDIIQESSPYITFPDKRVCFPTGLLIEKWLLYYYPILESQNDIPQINGENNLAFEKQFCALIKNYEARGGFSAFYNDLINKGIPVNLQADFFELVKKIRDTITKMPMKFIGRSLSNDFYSIFQYENKTLRSTPAIDIERLINDFGNFFIPFEYYEAFRIWGELHKWSGFSFIQVGRIFSKCFKAKYFHW